MVGVDLLHFFGGEHAHVDEAHVVGEQGEGLKLQVVAEVLGLFALHGEQQALGANAILAGLVEARLVAGDHARL